MVSHQRLLHAALGVARDVASRSSIAAGACHLRERIASGPLCLAAGRHVACASYHSQLAAPETLARRVTADDPSGWKAVMAANSLASSRCTAHTSASSSSSRDEAESVASETSTADMDGARSDTLPGLCRRVAPWQTTTVAAASSFSAFRPDPGGHALAACSAHPRHVFIAHRRLLSTAATAPAADGRRTGSRLGDSQPRAHDPPPTTMSAPALDDAGSGTNSGPQAGLQPSAPLTGQQPANPTRDFVYEGPLSAPVRRLKKLSLFSCVCSLAAAPIIASLGDAASSAGARTSIAVMVATIGIFTTGLLHWFTSPYVQRLAYDAATGVVEAHTLTVLAQPRVDRFPVVAVRYPRTLRPQATFEVNGKVFYVDADHFGDGELLMMLSPPDPDQPPPQQPSAAKLGGSSR